MSNRPSPDPKASMWDFIAWYLRVFRTQRHLHGPQFGESIGCSASTVSRLETSDLRLDEKRAALLDERHKTGGLFSLLVWYAQLGHDPNWLRQYLDLEVKAEIMRVFELQFVPGLLQTPEYAMKLFLATGARDPEKRVEERMARQTAVLLKEPPPQLWILLTQNVLDWTVGGPEVMRPQLGRLLEAMESPDVGIRVLPRSKGEHAGMGGSFSILSGPFGDVAYTEAIGGGRLVPSPAEVRSFGAKYDRIGQHALAEDDSRKLIKQVMEDLG